MGTVFEANYIELKKIEDHRDRLLAWKVRAIQLMIVNPTAEAEEIRLILEREFKDEKEPH